VIDAILVHLGERYGKVRIERRGDLAAFLPPGGADVGRPCPWMARHSASVSAFSDDRCRTRLDQKPGGMVGPAGHLGVVERMPEEDPCTHNRYRERRAREGVSAGDEQL